MIIELNKRKDGEWVDNVMDNAPKWMEKINNLIADYTSSDTKKRFVGGEDVIEYEDFTGTVRTSSGNSGGQPR